jgi:hypothetical protein
MSCKFGFHNMAALPAELDCLHMFHGPVGSLCADDDVRCSGHVEEDRKFPKIGAPVLADWESFLDPPPGKENTQRDQQQPGYEDSWDGDKDENADVRIAGVSSNLGRQNEESRKAGCGH